MRIAILGAAGDMAGRAAWEICLMPGIQEVILADRDASALKRLKKSLTGIKPVINIRVIDAHNHGELVSLMKTVDVAASGIGPFYHFEKRLVEAAIEAGCNYCSICDDWSAASDIFQAFNDEAKLAGVCIVTGLGASPGLTNIAAAYLSEKLDEVETIDISVYTPLNSGGGKAVIQHLFYILSHKVPFRENGKTQMYRPGSLNHIQKFPDKIKTRVYNMGHSEPATLYRFIEVKNVRFFMSLGTITRILAFCARLKLFESEKRRQFLSRILWPLHKKSVNSPKKGSLIVKVSGKKSGQPIEKILCGNGFMRECTGISLAVGAWMLGSRNLRHLKPGVYSPEGIYKPEEFLKQIMRRGTEIFQDIEMEKPFTLKN